MPAQEKIRPCSLSQRDAHACEYWRRYDNPDLFKSQLLFPLDCLLIDRQSTFHLFKPLSHSQDSIAIQTDSHRFNHSRVNFRPLIFRFALLRKSFCSVQIVTLRDRVCFLLTLLFWFPVHLGLVFFLKSSIFVNTQRKRSKTKLFSCQLCGYLRA